ncbi:MAG: hypothetical protein XU15_C0011G0161 [candidate division NC10 bacterium CSP1-5]|nr:MAG: hypothetical protein XU15_C0011G0017 [candidate division NC10 bacterium CSP1-5]KRT69479.1 MAG: hypothetical protein XU15_C0011G0161 [candidate division NC10 bacterium CSP1-5]
MTPYQQKVLEALDSQPRTILDVHDRVYPGLSWRGRSGAGRRGQVKSALYQLVNDGLAVKKHNPSGYYDWFTKKG